MDINQPFLVVFNLFAFISVAAQLLSLLEDYKTFVVVRMIFFAFTVIFAVLAGEVVLAILWTLLIVMSFIILFK